MSADINKAKAAPRRESYSSTVAEPLHTFEITTIGKPQHDPRLMDAERLRTYIECGGAPHVTRVARALLVPLLERSVEDLPKPVQGWGTLNQTIAVINGIRYCQAVQGKEVWQPRRAEIKEFRKEAGKLEGRRRASAAASVAQLFVAHGLLKSVTPVDQPLTAIAGLAEGAFLATTKGEEEQRLTIVPNLGRTTPFPGLPPDLLAIDPFSGAQVWQTVDAFCRTVLGKDPQEDQTLVCTI